MNYLIEEMVQDVKQGVESALPVYARLKELEQLIKQSQADIYEQAIEEAGQYGEKSFETKGYRFEVRNGRKTYHFDHIPEWVEAKNFMKEQEARFKDSASLYDKGQTLVDDNTGEQIPAATVTYSKDSIISKRV